jgi:hypothetical protein
MATRGSNQISRLNSRPNKDYEMSLVPSAPNPDDHRKPPRAEQEYSGWNLLMDAMMGYIHLEARNTERRATLDSTEAVRKSLASQYTFGKDCSDDICHPYTVAIKEIWWGFVEGEEIGPLTANKYEKNSAQALDNVTKCHAQFLNRPPVVPNLVSGLPVPFTVKASNSLLSAIDEPFSSRPHIHDPNSGETKHGRATWECRDMNNRVVTTKCVAFQKSQSITFNCNDVATQFTSALKKRKD